MKEYRANHSLCCFNYADVFSHPKCSRRCRNAAVLTRWTAGPKMILQVETRDLNPLVNLLLNKTIFEAIS